MADYEALYPGRFLKKETLAAPKTIRITKVTQSVLEGDKGKEAKVVVSYKSRDGEGEIVWCKTNAALTAVALDERDAEKWVGRLITIHNDPTVDLKGKQVGGIRVCGAPDMKRPQTVEIKRPRRSQPETYRLVTTGKVGVETSLPVDAPPAHERQVGEEG